MASSDNTPTNFSPLPAGIRFVQSIRNGLSARAVKWSKDGKLLAGLYSDMSVLVWECDSWKVRTYLPAPNSFKVIAAAFSENAQYVVYVSDKKRTHIWNISESKEEKVTSGQDTETGEEVHLIGPISRPEFEIWTKRPDYSPLDGFVKVLPQMQDGRVLTFEDSEHGQRDKRYSVFFAAAERGSIKLIGHHNGIINDLVVVEAAKIAISASSDRTLKVWDISASREIRTLEGHTAPIASLAVAPQSPFFASQDFSQILRIWNWETGECVGVVHQDALTISPTESQQQVSFHPCKPLLATIHGGVEPFIHIWKWDRQLLFERNRKANGKEVVQYANAKVVLVGDSGMGKSGLGLVLSGQAFSATESSHGRHVHVFSKEKIKLPQGGQESREILLWDLAGQPGYRLIHQLHLNEVAVALVVFDSRSETDPFAGVRHWDRALCQAQRLQPGQQSSLKKFLVAARVDRGGVGVGRQRIQAIVSELGFDGYFETSAREGWQVPELRDAIRKALQWDLLPKVNSTELFQAMKAYLLRTKVAGKLLATADELLAGFARTVFRRGKKATRKDSLTGAELLQRSLEKGAESRSELNNSFVTCIGRVEARGLIRRLSFGNLVLLQPELLDAYASALINAAKEEPDGQGSFGEDLAREGEFRMSSDERIAEREKEKLLCIATVQDLLNYDIALREQTQDGVQLVFPSQFTRDWPETTEPGERCVIFRFAGSVLNIYATLAVRLSHSGFFERKENWQNAASYTAQVGGTCGLFLGELGDGQGELSLFFDKEASEETRLQFEAFVHAHLRKRAIPESITCKRIFVCAQCREPVPDATVAVRRQRGLNSVPCARCDKNVTLEDIASRHVAESAARVAEMDRTADSGRERAVADSIVQGKRETDDFDVFLCHNGKDKMSVKVIAQALRERGMLPWLDEEQLQPGLPWQPKLAEQIKKIRAAAIFIGPHGLGHWQEFEQAGFLQYLVKNKRPVIPVILPSCPDPLPEVSPFLESLTWVDYRKSNPDPLGRLIWGISGKRETVVQRLNQTSE